MADNAPKKKKGKTPALADWKFPMKLFVIASCGLLLIAQGAGLEPGHPEKMTALLQKNPPAVPVPKYQPVQTPPSQTQTPCYTCGWDKPLTVIFNPIRPFGHPVVGVTNWTPVHFRTVPVGKKVDVGYPIRGGCPYYDGCY